LEPKRHRIEAEERRWISARRMDLLADRRWPWAARSPTGTLVRIPDPDEGGDEP